MKGKVPVHSDVRFVRALSKVKEVNDCWEWQGKTDPNGYGRFWMSDKPAREMLAHRYSYQYHVGEIPPLMLICHRCDNPPCVNPKHLFLGSHADNSADMVSKDRHARGERKTQAILTDTAVIDIRNRYNLRRRTRGVATRNDPNGARALAAEYGVSIWAIFDAVKGRRWAHVETPGL